MPSSKHIFLRAVVAFVATATLIFVALDSTYARQKVQINDFGVRPIQAHRHPPPQSLLQHSPGRSARTNVARPSGPHINAADHPDRSKPDTASTNVIIAGMRFLPATVHVKTGETVTWVNHEPMVHTLTSQNNGLLASQPLRRGSAFSHRFRQPGVYHYYCLMHPSKNGFVIVK